MPVTTKDVQSLFIYLFMCYLSVIYIHSYTSMNRKRAKIPSIICQSEKMHKKQCTYGHIDLYGTVSVLLRVGGDLSLSKNYISTCEKSYCQQTLKNVLVQTVWVHTTMHMCTQRTRRAHTNTLVVGTHAITGTMHIRT